MVDSNIIVSSFVAKFGIDYHCVISFIRVRTWLLHGSVGKDIALWIGMLSGHWSLGALLGSETQPQGS